MVNHPVFSQMYIRVQGALERFVGESRARQNRLAYGRTLIVGAGTGLDLATLPSAVTQVVLLEPDPSMQAYLHVHYPDYPVLTSSAEAIAETDQAYDTVISSLVLCSVSDVDQVLREIARVVKEGGQYLFMEHVRHERAVPSLVQDSLTPLWQKFAGGCQLNRDLAAHIHHSPLTIDRCEIVQDHFLMPILAGRATREVTLKN